MVETTNFRFNERSRFGVQYDNGLTDQNLHITERFTRSTADFITYRATIDDPTVYARVGDIPAAIIVTLAVIVVIRRRMTKTIRMTSTK